MVFWLTKRVFTRRFGVCVAVICRGVRQRFTSVGLRTASFCQVIAGDIGRFTGAESVLEFQAQPNLQEVIKSYVLDNGLALRYGANVRRCDRG